MSPLTETLARRAVERTVADRQAEYAHEMQRIVEATYELIERTGSLDPSLRDILAHTGLSTQAFYRLFRSKDELLLVLLDDGRRRLVDYLAGRMAGGRDAAPSKVRAWIEGVLAQASTPRAADRTRPFLANEDRLSELFPEEQRESVDLLVDLLVDPLAEASPGRRRVPTRPPRRRGRLPARVRRAARPSHPAHADRRPETIEHTVAVLPAGCRASTVGGRPVTADRRWATSAPNSCSRTTGSGCGRSDWHPGRRVRSTGTQLDHLLIQVAGDRIAVVPEPDSEGPFRQYLEADVVPGAVVEVARGGVEAARNVGTQPYLEVIVELKD